jgi:serine/threonine-protein kinase
MSEITGRLTTAIADRYRIERELGAGGMATVYLAHDVKHERKVALKVLRPELAAVIGAERFLAEIKVTANLQHPHILPLHDSGEADTFLYYVMPFVEGETLRDKIDREKQLGVEEALEITRSVAAALDYAHRQEVIHRDIKPENILLHDGQALVADFGIALALSHAGGARLTETGLSIGTPHYMSPEQAMGDRELDARSDVYSLGAMLYEMLAGDPPYTGSTAQAIVAKVITEKAASVTVHRDTVPAHVAASIEKALAKLPADRFHSASDFAEALSKPGMVPTVPATQAAPATVARGRRDWRLIGLAAALVVAVAAATVGWMRSTPPPESIRFRIAVTDHAIPVGLLGRDLALSPDGRTIVFSDTVGGERQLWIKLADRADATPLTGTAEGRAPAFSPDGEWIAFQAEGRLKKVPRLGGSAVTLADSGADAGLQAVAWMDDGNIAFTNSTLGVGLVGEDGGPVQNWTWVDSLSMAVVSVAGQSSGKGLMMTLCSFGCPESHLMGLDLRSGAVYHIADEALKAWSVGDGQVVFVRRDGGVFAAPFDPDAHEFESPPVPVLDGVRTALADADLALSANGTLMFVPGEAQAGGAPVEAVWVARDGRVTPVDSGWGYVPASNGGLDLSPDGERLAIAVRASGSDDIWVKELDRGPMTRLTFEGSNVRPTWSRDGRSVMYISGVGGGSPELLRRRADGTSSADTLIAATRAVWEVRPTADSTLLLVRLGIPPTRDIYLYDRGTPGDSGLTRLIADDGFEETAPAFSPDGRWLAYTTNESGRYEVYVRPFPEVNAGRWQVSRDGGSEPQWAHSGRELFYRSGRGQLIAASVQTGENFSVGEQRALFPVEGLLGSTAHAQYDVSPDDQRFVFTRIVGSGDADGAVTTAVLVQHWLNDLQTGRSSSR